MATKAEKKKQTKEEKNNKKQEKDKDDKDAQQPPKKCKDNQMKSSNLKRPPLDETLVSPKAVSLKGDEELDQIQSSFLEDDILGTSFLDPALPKPPTKMVIFAIYFGAIPEGYENH